MLPAPSSGCAPADGERRRPSHDRKIRAEQHHPRHRIYHDLWSDVVQMSLCLGVASFVFSFDSFSSLMDAVVPAYTVMVLLYGVTRCVVALQESDHTTNDGGSGSSFHKTDAGRTRTGSTGSHNTSTRFRTWSGFGKADDIVGTARAAIAATTDTANATNAAAAAATPTETVPRPLDTDHAQLRRFNGSWKLVKNVNVQALLAAQGVGLLRRKLAEAAEVTQDVAVDGHTITFTIRANVRGMGDVERVGTYTLGERQRVTQVETGLTFSDRVCSAEGGAVYTMERSEEAGKFRLDITNRLEDDDRSLVTETVLTSFRGGRKHKTLRASRLFHRIGPAAPTATTTHNTAAAAAVRNSGDDRPTRRLSTPPTSNVVAEVAAVPFRSMHGTYVTLDRHRFLSRVHEAGTDVTEAASQAHCTITMRYDDDAQRLHVRQSGLQESFDTTTTATTTPTQGVSFRRANDGFNLVRSYDDDGTTIRMEERYRWYDGGPGERRLRLETACHYCRSPTGGNGSGIYPVATTTTHSVQEFVRTGGAE